jgi:hypothetical protein
MFRVRHHDGSLTDLANISWAKDAALAIALARLNAGQEARETDVEGPPIAPDDDPLVGSPNASAKAPDGGRP